jgi:hypothetical protein
MNGGYVSTQIQNNPTYEFYPKKGEEVYMDFLNYTVPVNLFPLTWLMPSGKLFLQAGYRTILWDLDAQEETELPDNTDQQLRAYVVILWWIISRLFEIVRWRCWL